MSSVIVQKINIRHAGNVIIDTVPPVGTVLLNNGDGYTKSKKVSVTLNASDDTTGIKDIEVRNIDITLDSNGNEIEKKYDFIPLEYENNFFWNLNDEEGIKKVEVKFRDYANNISSYTSNTGVRKFYDIESEEINGIIKIGNYVYSSTIDDGKIYITKHYPKLIKDFEDENIICIISNNNVLYVATKFIIGSFIHSKVYTYLDGIFISLNTFISQVIDMASYNGELYVALEGQQLYKKDSSAWSLITTFSRPILYIDGELDYLYIVFDDSIETMQIYDGTSFREINISDMFEEIEILEESSSSESSSSSSSTRAKSSSTQTESTSSSSERSQSTSSITASELSSSTEVMSSSSSSSLSLSSSSILESSKPSSPSSESFSSESYQAQFSESSDSTPTESSSISSSHSSITSSSESTKSSSSSGDICDCGRFVDNSLYIDQLNFTNLKTIYTYQCNLFGRLVNIGGGWLRVLFYKDTNRSTENEVARSEDFYQMQVNKLININESNGTGITGQFMYVSLFAGTIPSNFVVLCEGKDTSSISSKSSSSTSSQHSYSSSQDVMIGSGTETDPFQIRTPENMVFVNANPNAYYILVNDIDMSSVESSLMDEYIPIGSEVVPFEGHFDGLGHKIINLSINRAVDDNIGIFGYTHNATIRRLGMYNADIRGKNSVGGLVGRAVGGLIEQCFVYGGTVRGSQAVGGLVGYLDSGADILNCYTRNSSLIGTSTVGGLIGFRRDSTSSVYCYSTSLNSSAATNKGGLIGGSGLIAYSFLGLKSQTPITHLGEDVDIDDSEGEIISSYWDVQSTGLASSDGGTGQTTAAMKIKNTFIGWDFIAIWDMQAYVNDGYPYLRDFPEFITNESSSSSTDVLELSSISSSSSLYEAIPLQVNKSIEKEITWIRR